MAIIPSLKGHYKLDIGNISESMYVTINIPNLITLSLYLIEPGDSIYINWDKGKPKFSGKGYQKFNCKYTLDTLPYNLVSSEVDSKTLSARNDSMFYPFLIRKTDSLYNIRLQVINVYKTKLSESAYNLLFTDCLGEKKYKLINSIRIDWTPNTQSQALGNFYRKIREYFSIDTTNPTVKIKSSTFSDFVFEKLVADALYLDNVSGDSLFPHLFKIISENYHGVLQEKLIATCFISLRPSGNDNTRYYKLAQSIIRDKWLLTKFNEIYGAYATGSQIYDFALEDPLGQLISPFNFRGKVMVLDFWFSGCGACEILSKSLNQDIIPYFKDSAVVFISICADKERDMWIKSINSGRYSGSDCINLYTNGSGSEHPLIKYYQFYGFPQLLVTNLNGRIYYANPKRPGRAGKKNEINREMTNKFIALIKNALTDSNF